MDGDQQKPFSKDYVVKTTLKHIKKAVDVSIAKTFERVTEFTGDPKGSEVFETLAVLHGIKKDVDKLYVANKQHLG